MDYKLFLLELIAIVLIQNFKSINSIVVKTKSGPINGVSVTFNNKVINQFLGIPYAEPPIGSNRFGKPKAVHPWNSTYDATHFRNSCVQKASAHNMSEDCLFLNVFSEERKTGDNKLRPVMFYIHGGGFYDGDGYVDSSVLSSNGVVTVSINYRLNVFGFLYGADPSAPGNVGILDQILALHWVKDNIEVFGGDPNEVTIFGISAGSWSVSTLIVSPLSKNLFKRAIMESGAYYGKLFVKSDKATHLAHSKTMAESLGCGDDNKWLDCLRNVSSDNIFKHNIVDVRSDNFFKHKIVEAALTYGDDAGVVPLGIEEALKQKKVNTGIEVMAGITSDEGLIFAMAFSLPQIKNLSIHITKDELKVQILSLFNRIPKIGESVYDYYISHIAESNQIALRRAYSAIFSDLILSCPTYYFAKEYSELSASDKIYFYELTYKSKFSQCSEDWMGVCHGDDEVFVFGVPISQKSLFTEADFVFSSMVIQMWTDFAKTGNPLSHSITNKLGTVVKSWPLFLDKKLSPIQAKVMELNPVKLGNVLVNPFHDSCDVVMRPYFE